ncbi:hypothetical protein [Alienimonas sp. DA493]|uniref:hypothetical protein n=1 Tax=Alienimonas sp. DA493 TaxID=3373605 RepID=UPI003753EBC6
MRPALPLLVAALLILGGAEVATAQQPGFGGAYRSPFPPAAWGPGPGVAPAPGWGGPGWGTPGWGVPPVGGFPPLPPPAPVGPPPSAPPYVPTGQAEIARPDPFGPPVRIEPRARETTVGGITARRYDYSFDVSPLLPTAGAPAEPAWNGGEAAW